MLKYWFIYPTCPIYFLFRVANSIIRPERRCNIQLESCPGYKGGQLVRNSKGDLKWIAGCLIGYPIIEKCFKNNLNVARYFLDKFCTFTYGFLIKKNVTSVFLSALNLNLIS